MKKQLWLLVISGLLSIDSIAFAHCQMPCGIYHDDMVYDQIDQYVETMYKGVTVLKDDHFKTVKDRNEFVRWVMNKEKMSDEVASLLTTYFLQQKIKPGEADTDKRLRSAHRLLFLTVQIKQNVDIKYVEEFTDEWDRFKLMFHVENYECKIEEIKQRKREQLKKEISEKDAAKEQAKDSDHDHDHGHDDHEHPHTH